MLIRAHGDRFFSFAGANWRILGCFYAASGASSGFNLNLKVSKLLDESSEFCFPSDNKFLNLFMCSAMNASLSDQYIYLQYPCW